jgi:hypothetical protein
MRRLRQTPAMMRTLLALILGTDNPEASRRDPEDDVKARTSWICRKPF